MRRFTASAVLAIVGFSFAPSAAAAADRGQPYDVLTWAGQQTPAQVTGPRSMLKVYYDAYRYTEASLSTSVAPSPAPNVGDLLKQVPNAPIFPGGGTTLPIGPGPVPRLRCTPLAKATPAPDAKLTYDQLQCMVSEATDAYRGIVIGTDADQRALAMGIDQERKAIQRLDQAVTKISGDENTVDARLAAEIGAATKCAEDFKKLITGHAAAGGCVVRATFGDIQFHSYPDDGLRGLAFKIQAVDIAVSSSKSKTSISDDEATLLHDQLGRLDLTAYLPGGATHDSVVAQMSTYLEWVNVLAAPEAPSDFALVDTTHGLCPAGVDGQVTTIHWSAIDRLATPDAASVGRDVVAVNCYARIVLAAGIGYSPIPANNYTLATTEFLVSSGPPPTFGTVTQIANTSSSGHSIGVSLAHFAMREHPGDGGELYYSAGFGISDGSVEVLYGVSYGLSRKVFVTIGGNFGQETVLSGGNNPGDVVDPTFMLQTSKRFRNKLPGITLSFAL